MAWGVEPYGRWRVSPMKKACVVQAWVGLQRQRLLQHLTLYVLNVGHLAFC